ncbi:MAG: hypothetical protein ACXVBE_15115 [Bdellovibrionota bacterium]
MNECSECEQRFCVCPLPPSDAALTEAKAESKDKKIEKVMQDRDAWRAMYFEIKAALQLIIDSGEKERDE